MTSGLRLVAFAALVGCGARSSLPLGTSAQEGASTGAGGGSTTPARCTAAIEADAPAPMLGDCSTRTFRTSVEAPASPHITWTAHLGGSGAIPTMVVDRDGHAFVADSNTNDAIHLRVRRIDPPGNVRWNLSFDGTVAGTPIVDREGQIRIVHLTSTSQPELLILRPEGTLVAQIALPNDSFTVAPLESLDPAVGSDGSLYLLLSEAAGDSGRLAKVARDGSVIWRSEQYGSSATGLALGADDTAYVAVDAIAFPDVAHVFAFDPADGSTRWERDLPGQPTAGPAVRDDGSIVVVTSEQGNGVLWAFEPDGTMRWSKKTGLATGVWFAVAQDGSMVFLTSYTEGTSPLVVGFDPEGNTRWSHPLPNAQFGGALDSSGVVLLAGEKLLALDAASGETRWTLEPAEHTCVWPMAPAGPKTFFALQCSGALFAASD